MPLNFSQKMAMDISGLSPIVSALASTTSATPVTVQGQVVYASEKAVSPTKAGLHPPPSLQFYSAAADPREFLFAASEFLPTGTLTPPVSGDIIICRGRGYMVSHNETQSSGAVATAYLVYCYRVLMAGDPNLQPVFPTEATQLWRPGTLRTAVNPSTMNVGDVGDSRQPDIVAFFVPLSMQEKMAAFGTLDLRVDAIYTNAPLQQNDVLYRPLLAEAWVVLAPSDTQPGTALILTHAKHLQQVPQQIRQTN